MADGRDAATPVGGGHHPEDGTVEVSGSRFLRLHGIMCTPERRNKREGFYTEGLSFPGIEWKHYHP